MLESLVQRMVLRGADSEEIISTAVCLSREAFKRMQALQRTLDRKFGSAEFRSLFVDPLVEKERQFEALKVRALSGGRLRSGEEHRLETLLQTRARELQALKDEFPWRALDADSRSLVFNYIEERREHLYLGDADRVKVLYVECLSRQAAA